MDLHSGFFQNHISCDDAQWLGITTPFGGLRYLKRSGQGLIGQSEELDEMLCRVLGHEMKEGKVEIYDLDKLNEIIMLLYDKSE